MDLTVTESCPSNQAWADSGSETDRWRAPLPEAGPHTVATTLCEASGQERILSGWGAGAPAPPLQQLSSLAVCL